MKFYLFLVCLLTICCGTASCGDCKTKHRRDFVLCGDNKCCCSLKMKVAMCNNHGKRVISIPSLPSYVRLLFFQNNYLPSVSRGTFMNLDTTRITGLFLVNDRISNMTQDAFVDFKALGALDLSGNKDLSMTSIASIINALPDEQHMRLGFMRMGWTNISGSILENLHEKKVYAMDIGGNHFHDFFLDHFFNITSLKTLKIASSAVYNIVTTMGHSTLEFLDLRDNRIGCSPLHFCGKQGNSSLFPNLRGLHLQGNLLHDISDVHLECLHRLRYLDLGENLISVLRTNAFSGLTNLQELRFMNMKSRISKIEESAFNNSHMESLQLHGNAIHFKSEMTNTIFVYCPNLRNLTLSHNNFYKLKDFEVLKMFSPLKHLTYLRIEDAYFSLFDGFLDLFPNLTYLNLDYNGNFIKSVGVSFKHTKNLRTVSLQSNGISVIREESFNSFTMGSIKYLNLAGNPFDCSCNMMWFRNAIDDRGKIGNIQLQLWPKRYFCQYSTHNSKGKSQLFSTYKPTKYSCQNQLLIALISVISFVVLCTVIATAVYKYRWYLAYWIYKAKTRRVPPERRPLLDAEGAATMEDVTYNGYVIYDVTDAAFVHHTFRLLMEEKFGYRMHIWERDAPVGIAKVTVVADVIYASEHVVAVISEDVLEDSWLQFQNSIALDRQLELKREFLILVLLENINYSKLSKFWCVMFTRLMSTRWCADENNVKRRVFEQQILQHFGQAHDETVQ